MIARYAHSQQTTKYYVHRRTYTGQAEKLEHFFSCFDCMCFFLSVHSIDTTYERVPTYNSIQQIIQTILFDSTIRNNNTLYNFSHYSYCTTININYHHNISSKTTNSLETYQTKTVLLMMMKFSMV